jgi:exodeoxyribonuclease VII large subunit
VVSAVGHETDYTICDYVADLRAPTPSAAAELVAPDCLRIGQEVQAWAGAAFAAVQRRLNDQLAAVGGLAGRAERAAADVDRLRQRLDELERRGLAAVTSANRERQALLRRSGASLNALDPQATLDRGYAVVHKGGRVVSSIATVATGDDLVIKVSDGGFPARVGAAGQKRRRAARNGAASNPDQSREVERGVQPVLFP